MNHDIVLTTYGTIATEHRKSRRQVLYHMRFFRIVLDEGLLFYLEVKDNMFLLTRAKSPHHTLTPDKTLHGYHKYRCSSSLVSYRNTYLKQD